MKKIHSFEKRIEKTGRTTRKPRTSKKTIEKTKTKNPKAK
jgi:hypothetical protein